MSKKDKIYMPSGAGGLVRYGEEGKVLIKLKPEHVAYIVAALVAAELVLKFLF
jgi:preprotein translocase subunit Sec61beta